MKPGNKCWKLPFKGTEDEEDNPEAVVNVADAKVTSTDATIVYSSSFVGIKGIFTLTAQ